MNHMRHLLVTAFLIAITPVSEAAETTARFAIEHMTCVLCPITVKAAMAAVSGVIDVKVDFDRKESEVRYDDTQATPEAIAKASTDAGYPAARITQLP